MGTIAPDRSAARPRLLPGAKLTFTGILVNRARHCKARRDDRRAMPLRCRRAILQTAASSGGIALFVQGRGALRRELTACLRTGRPLRTPRARTRGRGKAFISSELMISQRPAEAAERPVPAKIAPARIDANALKVPVNWATSSVAGRHSPLT
jgi:hypothetical protein